MAGTHKTNSTGFDDHDTTTSATIGKRASTVLKAASKKLQESRLSRNGTRSRRLKSQKRLFRSQSDNHSNTGLSSPKTFVTWDDQSISTEMFVDQKGNSKRRNHNKNRRKFRLFNGSTNNITTIGKQKRNVDGIPSSVETSNQSSSLTVDEPTKKNGNKVKGKRQLKDKGASSGTSSNQIVKNDSYEWSALDDMFQCALNPMLSLCSSDTTTPNTTATTTAAAKPVAAM